MASGPAAQQTPPPKGGQPYFTDSKKGEVNELRGLLRNINVERDPKRKRDVIKKVIAYMTLGIDVSRLFNEMVMAIETKDLVVKKMVYLYLCNYAQEHPDMALMCINTMHRDCNNEDPMVRGLALRSLCSLRLPSIVEYISEPLRHSLTDNNAYVRKTGVMGILKLYHLKPEMVKESNLVDLVYNMIQDPDGSVVSNCMVVLNEIMLEEGGMAINQAIIHHLLGRINDFNEWGLCQVLDLVGRYQAADDQEVFNIMNMLDPVLRTSNSGVVLATIKVFIQLTRHMAHLHAQLYERLKAPILTLLASGTPELAYCLLKHTELLIHRCPGIFDEDYKQFYTKFSEPLHVKYLKIDLMATLANVNNMSDILEELSVYVSDVDAELARRSIQAIGKVGFKLPGGFELGVFEKLIEFLDLEVSYVRAEAILVLKNLLRKYPERRQGVVEVLPRLLRVVEESEAKAAALWMIGEYGEEIIEAPYMVEPVIDAYDDESSAAVKLELLTAATKLFFKRPPEMHKMLGRLLAAATNDTSSQDVHDRALLYYRLMKQDLAKASAVLTGNVSLRQVMNGFTEDRDVALNDALFREFNSLSVVYRQTAKAFIAADKRSRADVAAAMAADLDVGTMAAAAGGGMGAPSAGGGGGANRTPAEEAAFVEQAEMDAAIAASLADQEGGMPAAVAGGEVAAAGVVSFMPGMDPTPATPAAPMVDLLGFGGEEPEPVVAQSPLELSPTQAITQESFQSMWETWGEGEKRTCGVPAVPPAEVLDAHLSSASIFTIASGDLPDMTKLFIFAQAAPGSVGGTFLAECNVMRNSLTVDVTLKTDSPANLMLFWAKLEAKFAQVRA